MISRKLEAENEIYTKEKEKLIATSQEIQETNNHLKKQHENEIKRQEASRLAVENMVRKQSSLQNP